MICNLLSEISEKGVGNVKKKKIFEAVCLAVVAVGILFILFYAAKINTNKTEEQPTDNTQGTVSASDVEYVRTPDPKVIAVTSEYQDDTAEYRLLLPLIQDCEDFASFEFLIKYNPEVLQFDVYPNDYVAPDISFTTRTVTEIEAGLLQVVGLQPYKERVGQMYFEMISFLVIDEGESGLDFEFVSCKNSKGDEIDCDFTFGFTDSAISIAPDTQADAIVTVDVNTPYYYSRKKDRKEYCGMEMTIHIQPYEKRFVECVLQVTYDPEVLQCSEYTICDVTLLDKLSKKVILQEDGRALIKVYGDGSHFTDPICFHVLSNEEIDLDVSLVSYTDEGGVRENARLVVDMPVKVPVVKDLSAD